ncbi:hypothetical protein [Mycobacterium shigaense]|uniref:Uncharacterized protein n=1 Tax=Mycobacterium shigaense TaxID=722731 RepID=A0A1Z4EM29_9MYCO|nr:hypothetical protein [Mycobacterium shigaense]MEA1120875.1 hypothetical protein [Mycobacterium shigaense]PRI14737.1 hypothetical protein B2J96_15660 [Mycobacterium shigaense]BAX94029.1 hypothetical protein MSG_03903 [Mycobacterium shigaense]
MDNSRVKVCVVGGAVRRNSAAAWVVAIDLDADGIYLRPNGIGATLRGAGPGPPFGHANAYIDYQICRKPLLCTAMDEQR